MSLPARSSPGACAYPARRPTTSSARRRTSVAMEDGAVFLGEPAGSPASGATGRSRRCSCARPTTPAAPRADLRTAAGRAPPAGADPGRARDVRVDRFDPFDSGRRPRHPALDPQRPWHADRIGIVGPSYFGLVQSAVAPDAGGDPVGAVDPGQRFAVPGQAYAGGSLRWRAPARGWCSSPRRNAGSRRWRWPARCAGCRPVLRTAALQLDERRDRLGDSPGFARRWPARGAEDAYSGRPRLHGRRGQAPRPCI